MIMRQYHFRPRSFLDIQHKARRCTLNVEKRLHKQDRLYSREQNVAAYANIVRVRTATLP
jgi:hypothetical protein